MNETEQGHDRSSHNWLVWTVASAVGAAIVLWGVIAMLS